MGRSGQFDRRGVARESLPSGLPCHTKREGNLVSSVVTGQLGGQLAQRQVHLAGGVHRAAQRRESVLASDSTGCFLHRVDAVQERRHGYSVQALTTTVAMSSVLACRAICVNGVTNQYELVGLVGN